MGVWVHANTHAHAHIHTHTNTKGKYRRRNKAEIFSSLKFYGCSFCHSRVAQNEKCSYRIDLFTAKEDVSLF